MKKLIVLLMTLALLALAVPTLAQTNLIDKGSGTFDNNVQGTLAVDDSVNKGSTNSTNVLQGAQANFGTVKTGANVDSNVTADTWNLTWIGTNAAQSNDTQIYNETNIGGTWVLDNSLNGNKVFVGDMTNAFTNQHQFEHQFDHQVFFPTTFAGSTDATIYMPISNVHMQQSNTGIVAGSGAGSVQNCAAGFAAEKAQIEGMLTYNINTGGVGTNQAVLNVVTAFSAP